MSVKDGLLALLAGGPCHGYQLKMDFEERTGGTWTINVGQIYTSLQRLERDGLITPVPSDDDGERISYGLTDAGHDHLRRWLRTPVERTTEARNEVVMKLLLAVAAPSEDPQEVIDAQRAATVLALQEQTRAKAGVRDTATLIQLDRAVLTCRAELDWLELAEQRLAQAHGDRGGSPAARTPEAPHISTPDAIGVSTPVASTHDAVGVMTTEAGPTR